jgi:hypothetical protein
MDDKAILQAAHDLAQHKLATCDEPPWNWYRYMQLREACERLIEGMNSVRLATEDGVEVDRHGNIPVTLPS